MKLLTLANRIKIPSAVVMSLRCPQTGLIFALLLALSGGALLGQNRSILNIENELVHWIIVLGAVLELCLIAFYIGLFFRLQKFDHNEYWRQDILQMMEKDSSIVKIQGKRMHKTIILEEFTRPEPGSTKNSASGFFSIFPMLTIAAASDVPPTTNSNSDSDSLTDNSSIETVTTESIKNTVSEEPASRISSDEESKILKMISPSSSYISSASEETLMSPEGVTEENGSRSCDSLIENSIETDTAESDKNTASETSVSRISSDEELKTEETKYKESKSEESESEESKSEESASRISSDEELNSETSPIMPGTYFIIRINFTAKFQSLIEILSEPTVAPLPIRNRSPTTSKSTMSKPATVETSGKKQIDKTVMPKANHMPKTEDRKHVIDRISTPPKENCLILVAMKEPEFKRLATHKIVYIQHWKYSGEMEEIGMRLGGKDASLKKRMKEVSSIELKPQRGISHEKESKQDRSTTRSGNFDFRLN